MFTIRASDGTVVSKGGLSTVFLRRLNFWQMVDGKSTNAFPNDKKPYFDEGDVLVVPPDARPVLPDAKISVEFGVSASSSSSYTFTTYTFYWRKTPPTLQDCLFDPCGGTLYGRSEPLCRPYEPGKAFSSLPSAVRLGYEANGWYTARTGGTKVTTSTTVKADHAHLYQQWIEKSCKVTFDSNGGTGERHAQTFTGGEVASGCLDANVFTREGFVFAGWSTASNTAASAVRLADRAPLGELAATKLSHTAPLDLYAEWAPVAADMVYVPEAGFSVPKGWLESCGAKSTTDAEWLAAARAQAANGRPLWACYAAGLDPEDPQDDVRVTAIAAGGGEANLEYERRARCVYEEEGRQTLTEGVWRRRKSGDRFFRVRVHK